MSSDAEDTAHGRKPRILLVDDDAFLLRSVARLQTLHGHRVVTAPGGAEAIDVLTLDHDFDLVVFDMDMPPMHGPEFLRLALAAHTELRGRLVVATGRVDQNVERLAVDGACRVVAKPCSVDDVTALLNAR